MSVTLVRYAARMANTPERPRAILVGPDFHADDIGAFLDGYPDDQDPMVDLGGGLLVSLRELVADATADDEDAE